MLRTLFITVVDAVDLKNADRKGKSDPYVVVQVGGTTKQTSVKKNDLSPTWDERFVFDISHETVIQLEVRDKDTFGSDAIGAGLLPISEPLLKELRRGGAKVTVPLLAKATNSSAGQLRLIVQGEFSEPATPHPPQQYQTPSPLAGYSSAGSPPRYISSPPVPEGIRAAEQRRQQQHEAEAEALRQEVQRLQADIAHLKRQNQSLSEEQRAVVGPLKDELQHNKELLVHAVQCIEDLADHQKKLEASPARVGEVPRLVHSRRAPLAGQAKLQRRAATPKPPRERHFSVEAHPWGGDDLRSPYGSRYIAADYGYGPSSSNGWRASDYPGQPLLYRDGQEVPCYPSCNPALPDPAQRRYYSASYLTPLCVPSPNPASAVYPTPMTVYGGSARLAAPYTAEVSQRRSSMPNRVYENDPRFQLLSNFQVD
eukprot:EG_transcript_10292